MTQFPTLPHDPTKNREMLSTSPHINVIAIDGPAASGKSSVARLLAQKLHLVFVSSGYYYRALAWAAWREQIDLSNEKKVEAWLSPLQLTTHILHGEAQVFINDHNPNDELFKDEINALVSHVAGLPAIRNFLLPKLRSLAIDHDLVMEGRDIGSVVFPDAFFKFYLDASIEERMRRRHHEGKNDAIAERDAKDSSRTLAPLLIPPGATVIDTTRLSVEEVAEQIKSMISCEQS